MDTQTIILASMIVHLAEHIETGERTDLGSAQGLASDEGIRELFQSLHQNALLPLTRGPVQFISDMLS